MKNQEAAYAGTRHRHRPAVRSDELIVRTGDPGAAFQGGNLMNAINEVVESFIVDRGMLPEVAALHLRVYLGSMVDLHDMHVVPSLSPDGWGVR